jgi:hypothetical protein
MPAQNIIKFRQGTASEWSSTNPVLSVGEPGFDTTNNQVRIGDGISSWTNLSIVGTGLQGIQGFDGIQGIQGIQGGEGPQGIQGNDGIQGIQGNDGSQGIQGLEGSQGASIQGIQGFTAEINWTGEWNIANAYNENDSVSYNGSSYVARQYIGSYSYGIDPTSTTYWQLLAAQGTQGIQGLDGIQGIQGSSATINWTGEWSSSTSYNENDGVSYNGSSFVALQSSTNVDPSNASHWQLVAAQGIQGIQGEGIQGAQGSSAVINWTGEWSGSTTYYENDGVSYNGTSYVALQYSYSYFPDSNPSYWQIIASQGVQGAQGESIQGIQGTDGSSGAQGTDGSQGAQGSSAAINWTGEYNAYTGYNENDGVSYNGNSYVALQYSYNTDPTNTGYWQLIAAQGIQGVQGLQGEGIQGTQGPAGTDAYMQGTQGIQGTDGIQGIQGSDGLQGVQGISINWTGEWNSYTGYNENDGVSYNGSSYVALQYSNNVDPTNTAYWQIIASQGVQGIQGEGLQGIQGEAIQGPEGPQGIQGPSAIINWTGEWNSSINYYENDGVSYNSSSYVALQSSYNTDPTNTSYWQLIAAQGIQGVGIQGIQGTAASVNWTGEWSSGSSYYENDGVSYNGTSYVALQYSYSNTPDSSPSYWQVIASQGVQGLQGEGIQGVQGTDGIQGLDGIQGPQGESIQGIQGTDGLQGLDGTQGTQGIHGIQGVQGTTGPVAGSANQIVYKNSSNIASGDANLTWDGSELRATYLRSNNSSGDEGGELRFAVPATNSTINTTLNIDIYQNKLRIFEGGGSNRGYYLDITEGATSAATPLKTKSIGFFTARDNQPPSTLFATLDTRNTILVLDFDDGASNEAAVFLGVIPDSANLASGLSVRINWMATSATSGNCRWGVQFEKMTTDEDADSFDTATEAHSATNATAGIPTITTLTCTSIDSLAAGDFFRMKVYRDSSDTTNDTMVGDAELISVEIRTVV